MGWSIEKLAPQHDREGFDCGNALLNNYLHVLAGQYSRRDLGQTYVAHPADSNRVVGYYTISASGLEYQMLPQAMQKGLPRIQMPVVLLGRLAVDQSCQRRGIGRVLMIDAMVRVARLASELGIRAMEVEAINENAREFYLRHGFVSLQDDLRHLYLPMAAVRKWVEQVEQ
ncbi:MAG: hypothetical protein AMXMBFR13_03970 [Phycisphaerae bacterium]